MFDRFTRTSLGAPLATVITVAVLALVAACGKSPGSDAQAITETRSVGTTYVVHDTTIDATFDATGVVAPIQQATLSTKLIGSVTDVLVHEGDRVERGQELMRIDARELSAQSARARAAIAEA